MIAIDYIDNFMNHIILLCIKYISKIDMPNVMIKLLKIFTSQLETKLSFQFYIFLFYTE